MVIALKRAKNNGKKVIADEISFAWTLIIKKKYETKCPKDYITELDTLDSDIQKGPLEGVQKTRSFIVFHPAFGYLC